MTDSLPPVLLDRVATLVDQQQKTLFVVAFCPICDRTEKVAVVDDQSREHAKTASIAKIQNHIRKHHRPKLLRIKTAPICHS